MYIYISTSRLCNGAAASLPWKLLRTYLESCANIVQAVVGAGLIQFVNGSHSCLAADFTLEKNLFPLPFSRALIYGSHQCR